MNEQSIRNAICALRSQVSTFTTIDIIMKIAGHYIIASQTPPKLSPNAQFGKFLSKNSSELGIQKIDTKTIKINDKHTSTAIWQ